MEQSDSMPVNMLDKMLVQIKKNLPANVNAEDVLFKAKYILTELLTNAVKHANGANIHVRFEITENYICFIKTDDGNPLQVPATSHRLFKNASIIASDIMHTVYAVKRNNRLYFYCHENKEPILSVENDFPEHFGLLIITKAADEFYYTYNPANKHNTFAAKVNFKAV